LDTYLEEEKGIVGGVSTIDDDDFSRDSHKITYGDGEEVRYSDVLDYFTSRLEYESVNYTDIMSTM
jgi:hypothetical protein